MNKTLNNKSNLPSSGDNNSTIVNLDNSLIVEILGINNEFNPRFLRKYNNLHEQMRTAFEDYIKDVRSGDFPNASEQY